MEFLLQSVIFISRVAVIPSVKNTVISYPTRQHASMCYVSSPGILAFPGLQCFGWKKKWRNRQWPVAKGMLSSWQDWRTVKEAPGTDCQDNFLNNCSLMPSGSSLTSYKEAINRAFAGCYWLATSLHLKAIWPFLHLSAWFKVLKVSKQPDILWQYTNSH